MSYRDLKLGRVASPARKLDRRLLLENYLELSQLTDIIPEEFDFTLGVPQPMFGNDQYGDCVLAGRAHMVQSWQYNVRGLCDSISEAQVLADYSRCTGFSPNNPATDNGWDLLSSLEDWKSAGALGRYKIGAFVAVNPKHHAMMRAASFLFGGLYLAFDLPLTAQDQDIWDYVKSTGDGAPGSWGGHCVTHQRVVGGHNGCVTWGGVKPYTWAFNDAYCPEAYAIISPDYLVGGRTIAGFDAAALTADLAIVSR